MAAILCAKRQQFHHCSDNGVSRLVKPPRMASFRTELTSSKRKFVETNSRDWFATVSVCKKRRSVGRKRRYRPPSFWCAASGTDAEEIMNICKNKEDKKQPCSDSDGGTRVSDDEESSDFEDRLTLSEMKERRSSSSSMEVKFDGSHSHSHSHSHGSSAEKLKVSLSIFVSLPYN